MKEPRIHNQIREQVAADQKQNSQPGFGIVLAYDKETNTATVLMAQQDSALPGELFQNVPCPVQMGLQTVAPEPGRECWIHFRDGVQSHPMISHFFNHAYEDVDYFKQTRAQNSIPRFMLEL